MLSMFSQLTQLDSIIALIRTNPVYEKIFAEALSRFENERDLRETAIQAAFNLTARIKDLEAELHKLRHKDRDLDAEKEKAVLVAVEAERSRASEERALAISKAKHDVQVQLDAALKREQEASLEWAHRLEETESKLKEQIKELQDQYEGEKRQFETKRTTFDEQLNTALNEEIKARERVDAMASTMQVCAINVQHHLRMIETKKSAPTYRRSSRRRGMMSY